MVSHNDDQDQKPDPQNPNSAAARLRRFGSGISSPVSSIWPFSSGVTGSTEQRLESPSPSWIQGFRSRLQSVQTSSQDNSESVDNKSTFAANNDHFSSLGNSLLGNTNQCHIASEDSFEDIPRFTPEINTGSDTSPSPSSEIALEKQNSSLQAYLSSIRFHEPIDSPLSDCFDDKDMDPLAKATSDLRLLDEQYRQSQQNNYNEQQCSSAVHQGSSSGQQYQRCSSATHSMDVNAQRSRSRSRSHSFSDSGLDYGMKLTPEHIARYEHLLDFEPDLTIAQLEKGVALAHRRHREGDSTWTNTAELFRSNLSDPTPSDTKDKGKARSTSIEEPQSQPAHVPTAAEQTIYAPLTTADGAVTSSNLRLLHLPNGTRYLYLDTSTQTPDNSPEDFTEMLAIMRIPTRALSHHPQLIHYLAFWERSTYLKGETRLYQHRFDAVLPNFADKIGIEANLLRARIDEAKAEQAAAGILNEDTFAEVRARSQQRRAQSLSQSPDAIQGGTDAETSRRPVQRKKKPKYELEMHLQLPDFLRREKAKRDALIAAASASVSGSVVSGSVSGSVAGDGDDEGEGAKKKRKKRSKAKGKGKGKETEKEVTEEDEDESQCSGPWLAIIRE